MQSSDTKPAAHAWTMAMRPAAWLFASVRARCRYTLPGLWTALAFAALSFTPSLLPHPAAFQGLVAGVDGAIGYGLGVAGAWIWREYADRDAHHSSAQARRILAIVAPAVMLVAILLGMRWQRQSAALIGSAPESAASALLVPVVAVLVFVLLVAMGRTVRTAYRKLAGWLEQHMGRRAARATGVVVLTAALFLTFTGLAWNRGISALDGSLAVGDLTTPRDISKPTTELRSGGPGSMIPWDSMGRQGRIFVGEGPDAGQISEITGKPAVEPIRIFAGLSSAETTEKAAQLAVDDLVQRCPAAPRLDARDARPPPQPAATRVDRLLLEASTVSGRSPGR